VRGGFVTNVGCPLYAWSAHGREVASVNPVADVYVTDRRPTFDPIDGVRWFWRMSAGDGSRVGGLPRKVFRRLKGFMPKLPDNAFIHRDYPSEREAFAALSDALIALVREQ